MTAVINLIASCTATFAIIGFFSVLTCITLVACFIGAGIADSARKRRARRRGPSATVAPAPKPTPYRPFDLPRRAVAQRPVEPTQADVERVITEAKRITRAAAADH